MINAKFCSGVVTLIFESNSKNPRRFISPRLSASPCGDIAHSTYVAYPAPSSNGLGIFARLYHRDGKDGYLKDMPLVMDYLRRACERYGELRPFLRLLDQFEDRQPQVGYTF